MISLYGFVDAANNSRLLTASDAVTLELQGTRMLVHFRAYGGLVTRDASEILLFHDTVAAVGWLKGAATLASCTIWKP